MYIYIYTQITPLGVAAHPHLLLRKINTTVPHTSLATLPGGLHVKLSGERLDVVFDEHTHLAAGCFRMLKMYRICIASKKKL